MKRKKPPILLVSVLVLAVLGLIIAAKPFGFYTLSGEEQQRQLQQEAEDRAKAQPHAAPEGKKPDSSAAVTDMKEKLHAGTPQSVAPTSEADEMPKNARTAAPTVVMPDDTVQKPKPNTSAPSGQWYDHK